MTDTQTELAALESVDLRKIELAFIAAVAERESALWSRFTENLARRKRRWPRRRRSRSWRVRPAS